MTHGFGKTFWSSCAAVAALLAVTSHAPAQTLKGDWPMANFDAHGLRNNPYETILTKKNVKSLKLAWKLNNIASPHFEEQISWPAVANGVLYVGSISGRFYAVDAWTGAQIWTRKLSKLAILNSPAVANGVVYISYTADTTPQHGRLRAIDAASGATLWTAKLSYAAAGSPIVSDGRVFQSDGNGALNAFDAVSGKQLWETDRFGGTWQVPAAENGMVYSLGDQSLEAYSAATGTKLWEQDGFIGTICCGSPAVASGVVYANTTGQVGAFDSATGTAVWMNRIGPNVNASIAVAKSHIYTLDQAGVVWNFDATNGVPSLMQEEVGFNATPTVANGVLYAGANDGVRAYDIKTGGLLWSTPIAVGVQSPPVVANGMVYVVAGSLYAFALPN